MPIAYAVIVHEEDAGAMLHSDVYRSQTGHIYCGGQCLSAEIAQYATTQMHDTRLAPDTTKHASTKHY